jgi:hypothetical protein
LNVTSLNISHLENQLLLLAQVLVNAKLTTFLHFIPIQKTEYSKKKEEEERMRLTHTAEGYYSYVSPGGDFNQLQSQALIEMNIYLCHCRQF